MVEHGGGVSRDPNPLAQRDLEVEGEERRFWNLLRWDAVKWESQTRVREELATWIGSVLSSDRFPMRI